MNTPNMLTDEIVFKNAYNELYNKLLRFVVGYISDLDEAKTSFKTVLPSYGKTVIKS